MKYVMILNHYSQTSVYDRSVCILPLFNILMKKLSFSDIIKVILKFKERGKYGKLSIIQYMLRKTVKWSGLSIFDFSNVSK